MRLSRLAAAIIPVAASLAAPGNAQLLSETVTDTTRVCTYYGSDTNPDGQVLPRTYTVGAGQDCPATAPYRDPEAPVPANAALSGERTGATTRSCLYSQGGLNYEIAVDLSVRCAMTPALLERDRAAAR